MNTGSPTSHINLVKAAKKLLKGRQKDKYYVNVYETRIDLYTDEPKTFLKCEWRSWSKSRLKRSIKSANNNSLGFTFSEIKPLIRC